MPLSNDVLMSLVSAGICADDVFFIILVGRGSKEHVVDLLDFGQRHMGEILMW